MMWGKGKLRFVDELDTGEKVELESGEVVELWG